MLKAKTDTEANLGASDSTGGGAAAMARTSSYTLDLNRHVAMWFNAAHKSEWLPLPIQKALQKKREDNPGIIMTLLFSSTLLSLLAQQALAEFAERHNIILMDFDKIDKASLTPLDKKLYKLACIERNNLEQPEAVGGPTFMGGGNPAAMSDLCRWISPIWQAGIYADAGDVHFKVAETSEIVGLKAPILSGIEFEGRKTECNDIIALPKPDNDYSKQKQIDFILKIQKKLIANYTGSLEDHLDTFLPEDHVRNLLDTGSLDSFFKFHKRPNIFNLRRWLHQHSDTLYGTLKLRWPALEHCFYAEKKKGHQISLYWGQMSINIHRKEINPPRFSSEALAYWEKFLCEQIFPDDKEDLKNPKKLAQETIAWLSQKLRRSLVMNFSGPGDNGLPNLFKTLHPFSTEETILRALKSASIFHAAPGVFSHPKVERTCMTWSPHGREHMISSSEKITEAPAILHAHSLASGGSGAAETSSTPIVSIKAINFKI